MTNQYFDSFIIDYQSYIIAFSEFIIKIMIKILV
jgi:hypothetical protein